MAQADQDRRIDYIELPSPDLEASKRFYDEVFGWEFEDFGPHYVAFRDGRLSGGFFRSDSLADRGALIVIYAKSLGEMTDKIVKAGGTIVKELFEFPGGRRFHFADPAGNILAIWSDQEDQEV